MKVLALIPARGGSKGVPEKNIKELGNKPLVAHAIECAIQSTYVSKIVLSTDDEKIATIGRQYDIDVLKRPAYLAEDNSNVVETVEHVIKEYNEDFDIIVLLQPTSPLRTYSDLDNIVNLLIDKTEIDGVISVVPMNDTHPARMYNLMENHELSPLIDSGESMRRQDLTPVYYRNGCFYAVRTKAFKTQKTFMVEKKIAYVMNPDWLVNIDTIRDFKLATLLYEDWKKEITNY
ncbi:N-acylneuraminate cytidylyltransferase [Flavobacterium sp. ACN2]|jgi:CMP-N,N'-diacetyllegionaminic acid synthase|uniref:acylneuraminate cytidylyltransferase family protein n=1 Tax=Flavobacterium sp. ACN2 TaxID=1975676 RepID=UPI000BB2FB61|nr:acylneuraminate cytidylyltransferase family protein [Flavobacterium sp. ACN2]PBI89467.1 N-acylneuraminate cytidylyltransferase [Flavobacterium sp. ACN2]